MAKKKIALLTLIILFLSLTSFFVVRAAGKGFCPYAKGGIVPCGRFTDDPKTTKICECLPCNLCHIFLLIKRLVDLDPQSLGLIPTIIIPLGILMLVIGGAMVIISSGNPARMSKGKSIITAALIGFTLYLAGWLIVNFVIFFATEGRVPNPGEIGKIFGQPWYDIECPYCGDKKCQDGVHFFPNIGEDFMNCPYDCGNFLWVPNSDGNRIIQIDPLTGTKKYIYDVGKNPSRVTVMPGGEVWVGNRDDPGGIGTCQVPGGGPCDASVTKLRPKSNSTTGEYEVVGTFRLGGCGGTRAITYDFAGDIWIGNAYDDTITRINPETGAITFGPFSIHNPVIHVCNPALCDCFGPYGAIGDPYGNVWFLIRDEQKIARFNINSSPPTYNNPPAIAPANALYGMAMDNEGDIWVSAGLEIWEIHGGKDDGTPTDTILNKCNFGAMCSGVAVDADNNVWAADPNTNSVYVIKGGDCTQVVSLPGVCARAVPHGVAIDFNNRAWIVCRTGEALALELNGGVINKVLGLDYDLQTDGYCAVPPDNCSYNYSDMTGFRSLGCPRPY